VEALLAEGAKVAFCARNAAEVEKAAGELGAVGTSLDVADGAALTAWVTASAEQLGGIDVAVATVSALAIGPGEDNWKAGFEVDLMHTVRMSEAATPYLEASKGSVVAVASVSGREVDFAKDVAADLPLLTLADVLGVLYGLSSGVARHRSQAHHRRSFFNRNLKVVAHAHRELAGTFTKMSLRLQFVAQLAQCFEVGTRTVGIFEVRRQGHQSNQAKPLTLWQRAQQFRQLAWLDAVSRSVIYSQQETAAAHIATLHAQQQNRNACTECQALATSDPTDCAGMQTATCEADVAYAKSAIQDVEAAVVRYAAPDSAAALAQLCQPEAAGRRPRRCVP